MTLFYFFNIESGTNLWKIKTSFSTNTKDSNYNSVYDFITSISDVVTSAVLEIKKSNNIPVNDLKYAMRVPVLAYMIVN